MKLSDIRRVLSRVVFVLVVFLPGLGSAQAQTTVRQILMVQNSGWMLPFYEDPENRFRSSVTDFANRLFPFSSELVIASFNQTVGENKSPLLQYQGKDPGELMRAINGIQLAKKPGGAYADTDFREALVTAITQYSPGQPALIWVVTNNRNSPNNSAETVVKNKEFYNFLQNTPEIVRIVGYPQKLAVVSQTRRDYTANGLMFYGMAYGAGADAVLRQMLDSRRVFGQASVARLKPLNVEALTFIPTSVENPDISVRLSDHDRKTLILTFPASRKPESARLNGKLRNDFFPYDIQSATLSLDAVGFQHSGRDKLDVRLSDIGRLSVAAGQESPTVGIELQIPPLPSMFSPEVVFGSGYSLAGVLRFQLKDQKLGVSPEFVASMNDLFPRDPLPDLFVPGESSRGSITEQPLIIQVEYPVWPLMVAAGALLVMLGGVFGGFLLLGRASKFKVVIDGHERIYSLKAFGKAELRNIHGERIGTIQRGLGRPTAVKDEKFKAVSIRIH